MPVQKMADPFEMSFGLWTLASQWKHVLHGATWRIWLNRQCASAMRPYVRLFLRLVLF